VTCAPTADRTVTLDGVAFEVDAALVGERVTLRFDRGVRAGRLTSPHDGA
jgi:hypothetical protein